METIQKTKEKIIFKAKIEEGLANAIRRYTYEIPVLAIDEVEISRNDSALYDETIAHRMGLIPFVNPKSVPKNKEFKVKLKAKKEGFVNSGEFEGDIQPALENIPITHLNKGQELELEASLKLGKGSEHSKFCPGLMVYRNIIEVKGDKGPSEISELVKAEGTKTLQNPLASDLYETGFHHKNEGNLKHTDELIITIENFGQIPTEEIFTRAVDALQDDLKKISKKI